MKRPLILHQITTVDVAPAALPELAAACGCDQVSLFTYVPTAGMPPENSGYVFPMVTPDTKRAVLDSLAENNVCVNGVEYFPIAADIDVTDLKPSLALGRELGARRAVTLIFDDDSARAVDKLGALCDLAIAEDLAIGLEFTPLARGCKSLPQAAWFVNQVGKSELGIGVDFLHLVRSGSTAEDILALDAHYFRYAQMCDGHGLHASSDYFDEAHNREYPGAGDFPMVDIVNALPASIPIEVEVPSDKRLQASVPAARHAREAVSRARAIVEAAAPRR